MHAWTRGRPLAGLPAARRAARRHRWRGPRATTMGLRPAEREFLDASVAARDRGTTVRLRGGAAHDRGRAPGPAAHAASSSSPALADGARRRAGDVRLGAAPGRPRGRGRPRRHPAGAAPGQPLGRAAVARPRAVAAAGDGGGAGDGRSRLRRPRGDRRHPLGAAGARRAVRRDADTPTAARLGPAGVQGVWVLPVDELDGPRRGEHRSSAHRRGVPPLPRAPAARGGTGRRDRVPRRGRRLRRRPSRRRGRGRRRHQRRARRADRGVAAQPRRDRRALRPPHPPRSSSPSTCPRSRPPPRASTPTSTT